MSATDHSCTPTPDNVVVFRGFATWSTPDREIGGWVWVRRVKTGTTHRVRYEFTREREGIARREVNAIFRSRSDKRREQRGLRAKRRAAREQLPAVAEAHRQRMIHARLAPPTILRTALRREGAPHHDRCWQCRTPVDADLDLRCIKCGWVVCSNCTACLDTRLWGPHGRF